jgi:hypothetical protein
MLFKRISFPLYGPEYLFHPLPFLSWSTKFARSIPKRKTGMDSNNKRKIA